jgi:hypothetical protein
MGRQCREIDHVGRVRAEAVDGGDRVWTAHDVKIRVVVKAISW